MMKPGIELEPAYKLMAEYWHIKLTGVQNALRALTDEWPARVGRA